MSSDDVIKNGSSSDRHAKKNNFGHRKAASMLDDRIVMSLVRIVLESIVYGLFTFLRDMLYSIRAGESVDQTRAVVVVNRGHFRQSI